MPLITKATRGVRAVSTASIFVNAIRLIQLAILARLIAPSDFGLMAMAFVVMNFAKIVAEFGISSALIQKKEIETASLSSLYWFNVFVASLLYFVLILISGYVAELYSEPDLSLMIKIVGIGLLVSSLGQQYRALIEKELYFERLTKIDIVSAILEATISIWLATLGYGVYSLVWGYLAGATFTSLSLIITYRNDWRPAVRFKFNEVTDFLKFGSHLMGQRLVNYVSTNADYFIIGLIAGSQALGFYSLAYRLIDIPSTYLNRILSRVMFPLYSKMQDSQGKLKHGFLQVQEYSGIVNSLILFGIAASAPVFVPVIFGEQWHESILLLQILCVVGLTRSIAGTIGPLLLAKGRPDLGFKWSIFVALVQPPSIYLGAHFGGVVGAAIAFATSQCFLLIFNYLFLVKPLLGSCLIEYLSKIVPSLLMGSILLIVVIFVEKALHQMDHTVILILQIIFGLSVYFVLLWLFKRPFLADIKKLVIGNTTTKNS